MKRILRFYILYFYIKKLQYFLVLLKISFKSYNFLFQLSSSQKLYLSFPRIKNKILPSIFLANKISIAQRNRVVVKLHEFSSVRFDAIPIKRNFEFVAKSHCQCRNIYLTLSRRESISPVVSTTMLNRGWSGSFDEDSPIKDTKGNHEERYTANTNRLILTS